MYFNPESDVSELVYSLRDRNREFAGKTILCLGCYGFLGKAMLSYLFFLNDAIFSKKDACKIIGSDNFVVGSIDVQIERPDFTFVRHDICQDLFEAFASYDIDYILCFSGIADPKKYATIPLTTFQIGTQGTINVLQLAKYKNVKSVLMFSSSEVYGDPHPAFIPTQEDYNGNLPSIGERACYDTSKRCILTLTDIFHRKYNVNTKVILPFNVFGAGMSLRDGRVLPSFVREVLGGKKMQVFGEGEETRTFVYITDFMNGMILALLEGRSGEIWNIGNQENEISMLNLAKLVQRISGRRDCIEMITPPPVYKKQPTRRCPCIEKAKRELGYDPKISLTEGVTRYWNWAKSI